MLQVLLVVRGREGLSSPLMYGHNLRSHIWMHHLISPLVGVVYKESDRVEPRQIFAGRATLCLSSLKQSHWPFIGYGVARTPVLPGWQSLLPECQPWRWKSFAAPSLRQDGCKMTRSETSWWACTSRSVCPPMFFLA